MTGKTHQVIGTSAGLATVLLQAVPTYQPATLGWAVVLSSIGALLPDIDQPTSRLWKSLPFGFVAGELVNPFLEHRNLTHSLLGFTAVSTLVWQLLVRLPMYWGVDIHVVFVAFLAAYASHLIADMVTVEGIPLLFPSSRMFGLPPRPFEGVRIITGGWFENLIIFPLADALLVSLVLAGWPIIRIIAFK